MCRQESVLIALPSQDIKVAEWSHRLLFSNSDEEIGSRKGGDEKGREPDSRTETNCLCCMPEQTSVQFHCFIQKRPKVAPDPSPSLPSPRTLLLYLSYIYVLIYGGSLHQHVAYSICVYVISKHLLTVTRAHAYKQTDQLDFHRFLVTTFQTLNPSISFSFQPRFIQGS